jgi:hypothetical protein
MGEHDKNSIVWDEIIVYAGDAVWKRVPPEPYYRGGPVLDMIERARSAIRQLLAKSGSQRLSTLGTIGEWGNREWFQASAVPTLPADRLCESQAFYAEELDLENRLLNTLRD